LLGACTAKERQVAKGTQKTFCDPRPEYQANVTNRIPFLSSVPALALQNVVELAQKK